MGAPFANASTIGAPAMPFHAAKRSTTLRAGMTSPAKTTGARGPNALPRPLTSTGVLGRCHDPQVQLPCGLVGRRDDGVLSATVVNLVADARKRQCVAVNLGVKRGAPNDDHHRTAPCILFSAFALLICYSGAPRAATAISGTSAAHTGRSDTGWHGVRRSSRTASWWARLRA